jgi:hypothetical protein
MDKDELDARCERVHKACEKISTIMLNHELDDADRLTILELIATSTVGCAAASTGDMLKARTEILDGLRASIEENLQVADRELFRRHAH